MNELRDQLKYGDMRTIADLTGLSWETVRSTLYGRRNNPKVKEAAKRLLDSQAKLKRELNPVK